MRYLHDRSRFANELLPPAIRTGDRVPPDAVDRAVWHLLGTRCDPEVRTSSAGPGGYWSRVASVASTPRSPFEAFASASVHGLRLPAPTAAIAGVCPSFRGFHERTWTSCAGNLHLTAVVPLRSSAVLGPMLTILPAVAARDAIIAASRGAIAPTIKWVNDLCLGAAKIGGVLTQTHVQGATIELVIAGLAINVAHAPQIEPTPFVPATARVPGVSLADLLQAVLAALGSRLEDLRTGGARSLLASYRAASSVVGRRVRVYADDRGDSRSPGEWPPPVAAGVVAGIRDDLSLVVEGAGDPVAKGRLAFEEDCVALGLAPAESVPML